MKDKNSKDRYIEIKFDSNWDDNGVAQFVSFLGRMNGVEGAVYKEEYNDGTFCMRVC